MASPLTQHDAAEARIRSEQDEAGRTVLWIEGRLDTDTAGRAWKDAMRLSGSARGAELVVDGSGLAYCDSAGASLLLALRRKQQVDGGRCTLRGLQPEVSALVDLITPGEHAGAEQGAGTERSFFARLGRHALGLLSDTRALLVFVGHVTSALVAAARHPGSVRWKDVTVIAERAGIGAVPIIALVGFLLGLILSFQSAAAMRQYGLEIYMADLLGKSMVRELGPLMAAILLTARSGSAFAAEIGTMKVNEEIDALTTMGLEPVRFLVVPRVIAAVLILPVLIMVMNLAGLAGGAVVFVSLDFPLVTFVNRVVDFTNLSDLLGGLLKGMVFGIIVAAVGCLRGTQTGAGASAVGQSTTSSVVSGIVLIAFASAVFAVVFYVLDI